MESKNLNIGWLGYHIEGMLAINEVIQSGYKIDAIITLDEKGKSIRSAVTDFTEIAENNSIPIFQISNINSEESITLLSNLELDILFVIGWSQILSQSVLNCLKIGAIGAHASLLPHNRGSAPVNWALINGEQVTGNSLIWLDERVDEGDLIYQEKIEINPFDTCKSLYEKVAITNRIMITQALMDFHLGIFPRITQDFKGSPILPRRKPSDGKINWEKNAVEIYNFIRALVKPYPGAFFNEKEITFIIWDASVLNIKCSFSSPAGTVVDHLIGPEKCGLIVQCGSNSIIILFEIEASETKETLVGESLLISFPVGMRLS